MNKRKSIQQKILNQLYAESHNECAMPDCHNKIWEGKNTNIGTVAHIEAYHEGGARFNFLFTDQQKNEYENLIIICSNCHKKIDSAGDISTFSVNILRRIKADHNEKIAGNSEIEYRTIEMLIANNQEKILRILRFIDSTKIQQIDSAEEWLKKALSFYKENNAEMACIGLPYTTDIVQSFTKIINSRSPFSTPIIRIISDRIEIYFSVVNEVCKTYLDTDVFRVELEKKYNKLKYLLYQHDFRIKGNVRQIADAIKRNELYLYRDFWNITNLRVVLKTLYDDKHSTDYEKKNELLDFIYGELVKEITLDFHHIPEIRHAWWTVITLVDKRNNEWVKLNIKDIELSLKKLLKREYKNDPNGKDKKSFIASELLSPDMEDLWVTINIIRFLKIITFKNILISSDLYQELKQRLRNNITIIKQDEHLSDGIKDQNKFIYFCIKIVLFKEYLSYLKGTGERVKLADA